jgi:hypothetical protein
LRRGNSSEELYMSVPLTPVTQKEAKESEENKKSDGDGESEGKDDREN